MRIWKFTGLPAHYCLCWLSLFLSFFLFFFFFKPSSLNLNLLLVIKTAFAYILLIQKLQTIINIRWIKEKKESILEGKQALLWGQIFSGWESSTPLASMELRCLHQLRKKPSKRTLSTISKIGLLTGIDDIFADFPGSIFCLNNTLNWILLLCSCVKVWSFQIFYPSHICGPVRVHGFWYVRHPFSGLKARTHMWQADCLRRVLRFTLSDG